MVRPKESNMSASLRVEGEPAPRFVVYLCDFNDDPCQRLAEYDSIADVLARKQRFDQVIKVSVGRKFLEWPEFVEWAKAQEGEIFQSALETEAAQAGSPSRYGR
jgi:hypothetical protein